VSSSMLIPLEYWIRVMLPLSTAKKVKAGITRTPFVPYFAARVLGVTSSGRGTNGVKSRNSADLPFVLPHRRSVNRGAQYIVEYRQMHSWRNKHLRFLGLQIRVEVLLAQSEDCCALGRHKYTHTKEDLCGSQAQDQPAA